MGFRYFVERVAAELKVTGYTRNLDDGRVEVYAVGPLEKLREMNQRLWQGPRFAEVRGVEEQGRRYENIAPFASRGDKSSYFVRHPYVTRRGKDSGTHRSY